MSRDRVRRCVPNTGESTWQTLRSWTPRQFGIAAIAALGVALLIGVPTDVIPEPGVRPAGAGDVVVVSDAGRHSRARRAPRRHVRPSAGTERRRVDALDDVDAPTRTGSVAGLLSFFAVGCPVCNKLVIVALGTTGARQWFEPLQPLLAVVSIGLLWWALRARLRNAATCRLG